MFYFSTSNLLLMQLSSRRWFKTSILVICDFVSREQFWFNLLDKLNYSLCRIKCSFIFVFASHFYFFNDAFSAVLFFILCWDVILNFCVSETLIVLIIFAPSAKLILGIFLTISVHILTLKNKIWLAQHSTILMFINNLICER